MEPERYQEIQAEFLRLREMNEVDRSSELSRLAGKDSELEESVRHLLKADSEADSFLAIGPPSNVAPPDDDFPESADVAQTQTFDIEKSSRENKLKRIGPYRILQQIGEGGHGVVYMAEQLEPIRRRVAIKCVKPGMGSKAILTRFEAERQALAIMFHPSIANVIDAGKTSLGQPFFVMELVHGIPIDQFCEENQLSLDERLRLFQQVCSAVHHAHQKGVIHRDIKPANVLVTVQSGNPLAKVIDFGIAKALHMPLTEKTMFTEYGQIVGTLEYMSPEQAMMSQNGADVRSDVYSLGALLYFLLTGKTPIGKEVLLKDGLWELRTVLREYHPPTPSLRLSKKSAAGKWREHGGTPAAWSGNLKGDLDWITMKALSKEPDLRYDSAAALSADIENYLQGDPVSARPPSLLYASRKLLQKHRVVATIMAMLAISTLISFAGLTWGYFKSLQNLSTATNATDLANQRAKLLKQSLFETEAERERADNSAKRLAGMLERRILENAWRQAMNGDSFSAKQTLDDIPESERGAVWQFVNSVSEQTDWPLMRNESQGAIRELAVHQPTGQVATITTDSKLELWDVRNRILTKTIQLKKSIYSYLNFSNDGSSVLVGTSGGVQLIDLDTDIATNKIDFGLGGIRAAIQDVTGKEWYVSTGANYLIKINVNDPIPVEKIELPQRINRLSLSPEGGLLAIAGSPNGCFFIRTRSLSTQVNVPTSGECTSFLWRDNELVVATSKGERLSLKIDKIRSAVEFDKATPNLQKLTFDRSPNKWASSRLSEVSLSDVSLSNKGNLIVSEQSGLVSYVDPESNRRIPIRSFESAISKSLMLQTTGELVVVHFDGSINVVSEQDISCMLSYTAGLSDMTDGRCLGRANVSLTGHKNGLLKRWNTTTGKLDASRKIHFAEIINLSAHERSGKVATMGSDWKIVVTAINDFANSQSFDVDLGVRNVAFSNNGKLLAGAPDRSNSKEMREGTIDLWDVSTGKTVARLAGHENWVISSQFYGDDSRLVSLALDGTVKIWSVTEGDCLQTIDLKSYANGNRFVINELKDEIIVSHADGSLSVWDLRSGNLRTTKRLFASEISGLVLTDDYSCLMVSVRNSSSVSCISPASLNLIAKLDGGIGNIVDMRSDYDVRRIQLLGAQGAIRIWPITTNKSLAPN